MLFTILAKSPKWLSRWPVITGVISSFLTMFFVASFTKSLGLSRQPHVAAHATMMTLQHELEVLILAVPGFAFAPWAPTIAAMFATGLLGAYVGKHALAGMSDHNFKLGRTSSLS